MFNEHEKDTKHSESFSCLGLEHEKEKTELIPGVPFSYYSAWSNADAHSHILNKLEWTSLLSIQVYFEELDLGLKKLHHGGEPYKGDIL